MELIGWGGVLEKRGSSRAPASENLGAAGGGWSCSGKTKDPVLAT